MAVEKQANGSAKKGDFVEIEFVGRNITANGEVFDTNIAEELKKLDPKAEPQPFIVCIGRGMAIKGFDEGLEGKEIGKKYKIQLSSDKAYGKRHKELVKLIPLKAFTEQKVHPQPGMTLALDNNLVKIISVSGGRVLVDFNNPLAGKELEFEFTIKRILSDTKEKASALQKFFFGQVFEFDTDEKSKKIVFKDTKLANLLNVFKDKFKEMLGYEVEIFEGKKKEEPSEKEEKK